MRWQTLEVKERDQIYLVLKDTWQNKVLISINIDLIMLNYTIVIQGRNKSWADFLGHFGQMKKIVLIESNFPKWQIHSEKSEIKNDFSQPRTYSSFVETTKELNWELLCDQLWKEVTKSQYYKTS